MGLCYFYEWTECLFKVGIMGLGIILNVALVVVDDTGYFQRGVMKVELSNVTGYF